MNWDHEKEFENMDKLTRYLKAIQRLDTANINRNKNGFWVLSFNLK